MLQTKDLGRQRLDAIRSEMRKRDLAALIIYSQKRGHVPYVSGYRPNYHTNSAFVVLPLEGEPALLIKFGFDSSRAASISWFSDIRASGTEDLAGMFLECCEIINQMKLQRARIGLVASDDTIDELSVSLSNAIQHALPQARIEPASDLINQMRMEKSPPEIMNLRKATEISESAAAAMQRCLVPGAEDYLAMANAALAANTLGADRCDAIISASPSDLALPPTHQRFRQGNPVSCELTVQYEGYWVQICRTFSLGAPSAEQKRVFAACRDAYEEALKVCRPGSPVAKVANVAVDSIDKSGYAGCIKYGLGHGVGLDLPEPYSVDAHSKGTLVNHMVLVVHVGVWVQGQGAAFVGGPVVIDQTGVTPLDHPQQDIIEV